MPEITQLAKAKLGLELGQPGSSLALPHRAICQRDQRQGQITEELTHLLEKQDAMLPSGYRLCLGLEVPGETLLPSELLT